MLNYQRVLQMKRIRGTMMMNHGMRVPNGMRQDGSDFLLDRFCFLNLYHICGDSVVERQNQRTSIFPKSSWDMTSNTPLFMIFSGKSGAGLLLILVSCASTNIHEDPCSVGKVRSLRWFVSRTKDI